MNSFHTINVALGQGGKGLTIWRYRLLWARWENVYRILGQMRYIQ